MTYESNSLTHYGVLGQKWGVRNGPPYPLGEKVRADSLYREMKEFDYGGIVNGKKILEPEYYDIDFGKEYRTIPLEVMKKEKIGNCWDMVNYQHAYFKKNGIKDHSFIVVMDLDDNGYNGDNVLTHTFSLFESDNGLYWFEQAWWTERGIKKVNSYRDILNKFIENNGDHNYFVSEYNPDGMDKNLTDKEFFKRATQNVIEDHEKGSENAIKHYGIAGQKWGVRRFQNEDGTLTEEGKNRYRVKDVVFVSGSSKTQDKESGYYRRQLPSEIRKELDSHIKKGNKVIVGDAPGIDRQVQDYLNKKKYENVEIFGPGKAVRYSANKKWKTNLIDDPDHEPMSKEWLAKKDEFMTNMATVGLAVILDEGASATRKNADRLISQNKNVKVFSINRNAPDSWVDYWDKRR